MRTALRTFLIGAAVIMSLASCDLFLLGPSLNLNYDDPDIGFGRFRSALIGDGEIRVGWDWIDIERKLRGLDPVYDQIIIKHSTGSYPVSRLGGEKFEISGWNPVTKPMWSTVFKDMKWDREHYFALYAHERDGRWMSPMYTSLYFDGFDTNMNSFPTELTVSGNFSGGGHPQGELSLDQADMYYYDIGEDGTVKSATISFDVTSPPAADDKIVIYPMRSRWDIPDFTSLNIGDAAVYPDQFYIDRSVRVEIPVSTAPVNPIERDITSVFAKAQYHGTNGILIVTGGSNISISTPPQIETNLVRRW